MRYSKIQYAGDASKRRVKKAMTEKEQLIKSLASLWTVQDLKRMFNRSHMTIHNWRRADGLPHIEIKGDVRSSIRFLPSEVRQWARKRGHKLNERQAA